MSTQHTHFVSCCRHPISFVAMCISHAPLLISVVFSSNWHPYMAFSFQCSSHLGGSNSASYTTLSSIRLVYSSLWILAFNAMPAIVHPLGVGLCSCMLFMGFRTAIFMPSLIDSKRCAVRLNPDLQKQVPFTLPGAIGHPPCCNACFSPAYLA